MFDVVNETVINSKNYKKRNPVTGVVEVIPSFAAIDASSDSNLINNNGTLGTSFSKYLDGSTVYSYDSMYSNIPGQVTKFSDPNVLFIAKRGFVGFSQLSSPKKVTRTIGWEATPDVARFSDTVLSNFYGNYSPNQKNYRLVVFSELSSGSNDGAFARMNPIKGRPEIYEFTINNGSSIAQQIVNQIHARGSKYPSLVAYVGVDGADLVLTAASGYVRFTHVALEHYGVVGDTHPYRWDEQNALSCSVKTATNSAPDPGIVHGTDGFGTYEWLTQNLKLPTDFNRSIVADKRDEYPIPGQLYDQYTWYTDSQKELGGIQSIVGGVATTRVGHTFYVPQGIAGPSSTLSYDFGAAVKAAFNAMDPTGFETVKWDAASGVISDNTISWTN